MNLELLLLMLTTLQCATGVFGRSYGDDAQIDVTKLTTNAARMRAGFPPLRPRNLIIPSRIQAGKIFYFNIHSNLIYLSLIKYERVIQRRQSCLHIRQSVLLMVNW